MMKVLAIYPGLNPVFDEVAHVLPQLVASGVAVQVITSRVSALKSTQLGSEYEDFQGVPIHRIFPDLHALGQRAAEFLPQVRAIADALQPDVLLVNSFHSLPLLELLRPDYPVPALLRVETADPLQLLRRRYYGGVPAIGRVAGRLRWWQVCGQVDALMSNDPIDLPHLSALGCRGRRTYYAAHCAQRPTEWRPARERQPDEMIYVGSLIRHKNCTRWLETVPAILEHTPVQRFTVIGRGPYRHVVDELRKRFGARIEYQEGMTRLEALERLSSAWFAYTESYSGWGFLCDAWSTRTPVLCPQSTFGVVPGWTGMMPQTLPGMLAAIRRLYEDPDYYSALQDGGALRYASEHTADVVSRQYLQILREVVAEGRHA